MGNDQFVYSNTIPDRLSCTTQLSKADSPSSTAGDQARNPSSSRKPTPIGGGKRKGVQQTQELRQTLIPCLKGYVGALKARVLHRKTPVTQQSTTIPVGPASDGATSNRLGSKSPSGETGAFPSSNRFTGETSYQQEQQPIDPTAGSASGRSNTLPSQGQSTDEATSLLQQRQSTADQHLWDSISLMRMEPQGASPPDGLMSASYDKIAISNSSERPSRRHLAPSSDKSVSINGPKPTLSRSRAILDDRIFLLLWVWTPTFYCFGFGHLHLPLWVWTPTFTALGLDTHIYCFGFGHPPFTALDLDTHLLPLWVWTPTFTALGLDTHLYRFGFGHPHLPLWVWTPTFTALGLDTHLYRFGFGHPHFTTLGLDTHLLMLWALRQQPSSHHWPSPALRPNSASVQQRLYSAQPEFQRQPSCVGPIQRTLAQFGPI
ncbi:hypothetical protein CRG98_019502 [Punica granatum]|uniref:Uncharacterized protein n=1 Tax=Punica granatum TaxID=22663 RepID=A0A2I0JUV5_PUNGR|nr:hypothetical protein CRG98_019502 [Punica granatum]